MARDLTALLSSDSLLSVLLLVFLVFLSLKILPAHFQSLHHSSNYAIAVEKAVHSFSQYESVSKAHLAQMRNTYSKGTRSNPNHRRIGTAIGYPEKLDRLERAIQVNSVVTRGICRLVKEDHDAVLSHSGGDEDVGRVREALKHFVRDWSVDGKPERDQIFTPILDILTRLEPHAFERADRQVLVPGAGLGRLAYEISQLGRPSSIDFKTETEPSRR